MLPAGRGSPPPRPISPWVTMCTSMSPDPLDGLDADAGAGQHRGQPGAAARAQHELGGVLRAGERQQRFGDIVSDHLVVGAAQRFGQAPLRGERRGAGAGEPVGADDVHGEQVAADRAGGDPGGAADQRLAFRAAGQRDDHPLAGFPGLPDAVLGPVLSRPSSTLSASHSKASSRRAVRLPTRK